MEIVASAPARLDLRAIGPWAARVEALGFDTIQVSETIHDPFAIAAMAVAHTTAVTVRTSMALAFPRSPMVMAYSAWDLARYSGGRFQLGVASQVRGNIVGRFSSQWSEPVSRLRDYIGALRAIFDAFQTGDELEYRGPHYTFTRLQPYFNPGPLDGPAPQIWTGGVNTKMCMLAGELSDGFVCHPINSHPLILRDRTLPTLADGVSNALSGRRFPAVVANPQPMIGATREDLAALRETRRTELAFLYSTPAYAHQLAYFGMAELAAALSAMARRSEWSDLGDHLTDEVLDRLIPQGIYADMADILTDWYSGLCTGLSLPVPDQDGDDRALAALVERCKSIPTLDTG